MAAASDIAARRAALGIVTRRDAAHAAQSNVVADLGAVLVRLGNELLTLPAPRPTPAPEHAAPQAAPAAAAPSAPEAPARPNLAKVLTIETPSIFGGGMLRADLEAESDGVVKVTAIVNGTKRETRYARQGDGTWLARVADRFGNVRTVSTRMS